MKISLLNYILVCLVILFAGLYWHQQFRSDQLEEQLSQVAKPQLAQVQASNAVIKNLNSQILALKRSLEAWSDSSANIEFGYDSDLSFQQAEGLRRHLVNIRNLEGRLKRESAILGQVNARLAETVERGAK